MHPLGPVWADAPTKEALACFAQADREAAQAVAAARESLARAVDLVAGCLGRGGRLIYVGAGTSGRLGALDAAECPPTFQSQPGQIQAILAGGPGAMTQAIEGAEDDAQAGEEAVRLLGLGPEDCVLGISASGGAPFVHGALGWARQAGAHTLFLACVSEQERRDDYEVSIRLVTGPELLAGSTRLKAGTATKMALGALSTLVMARLGKVLGHRMVDVNTGGNAKLWQRGVDLVQEIAGLERGPAEALLQAAHGSVKRACVMHACQLDREAADRWLERCNGHLSLALRQTGEPRDR
ncbi:MAG: N-acetylmuramic acid 6-phosphate etherase [Planctomycetes bacterium]|nr:N-acetylmuramic acid 6-phosphate etherase [Planctomycetota bacterium]HPF13000.1 N-acetylmuramic acid 6-phosphate etherase [Planctomycetota bacterium]